MKRTITFYFLVLTILSVYGFSVKSTIQDSQVQEQNKLLAESMKRGEMIYADFCLNCHLPDGSGTADNVPPLAQSDYLLNKRMASIKAIKFGQKGIITVNGKTYNSVMAPMGLDDEEVADVMNYILNSWGNRSEKIVSIEEVKKAAKE